MLSDEKILITGASGLVGREFAKALAPHNEVWGLSRYAASREGEINAWAVSREETEKMGVKTFAANLLGDLTGLPDDFTYVLHFAHTRLPAEQLYEAVAINSVGPGRVLQHCRKAKAALVVSSTAVYSWPADPEFAADERADLCRGAGPSFNPTSAASKLSLEAVSRFCANIFELPVTIMRLNVPYGPNSGMPIRDMDAIATGQPLMHGLLEPFPNTPIHFDDMIDQVEALLDAASTEATIVNWCGDEVVSQREWCDLAAKLAGREAIYGTVKAGYGNISDPTKRRSITGPCRRSFVEAFTEIYRLRHGGQVS